MRFQFRKKHYAKPQRFFHVCSFGTGSYGGKRFYRNCYQSNWFWPDFHSPKSWGDNA